MSAGRRPAPAASEADTTTVHSLIEQTAGSRPDTIAVDAGTGGQLSYRELDRRANRLAHELRARTRGRPDLVAVCLPRTADLIIGLLAVLKSGAAYLPLDDEQPSLRLRFMLADARPTLMLTTTELAGNLHHGGPTVLVDADQRAIAHHPATRPGLRTHPTGLAYVLYTSGSSGHPKGVAIEHRSAVEFLRWCGDAFGDAELAEIVASTSVGFDLSIFELFAPLAHGGTVVLARGPGRLGDHPGVRQARLLNTVPSVLETLLNTGGLPPALTTVNLAGEPLRCDLVDRLLHHRPGMRVGNLYGPTEATTYATAAWLRRGLRHSPIGKPIAGAELWLTDAAGEPVPVGAVGEILIGGGALARGYLGRPGLTAERFVPDHLSGRSGARLYTTGDLARVVPDADLLFLGRRDNQVKLRGVRVELEEVEALLQQHELVREAAVIVTGEDPRRRRLAAVVCTAGTGSPTSAELVEHIRLRAPAVMTPSRWVFADRLPRTPNGKLDRRAIEGMVGGAQPAGRVVPRTAIERAIADVWSDVLSLSQVGVHDAFFDVGGNSLLLLELHAALRRRVDERLRIADLFRCPTIASLASFLRDRDAGGAVSQGRVRGAQRRAIAGRRRTIPERAHGNT